MSTEPRQATGSRLRQLSTQRESAKQQSSENIYQGQTSGLGIPTQPRADEHETAERLSSSESVWLSSAEGEDWESELGEMSLLKDMLPMRPAGTGMVGSPWRMSPLRGVLPIAPMIASVCVCVMN